MRVPTSTYRLQVTPELDLFAAARRLAYLHDLGIGWVYLSPLLEAEPGSDHGYDVLRHDRIDPARGGGAGLDALSAEARRLGMGVLVDIVPNHVGVASASPGTWWWDLLTHGKASAYAAYFDVDWDAGGGRLLLPVVGDDDEAAIEVRPGQGEVRYREHLFPMAPGTSTLDEQSYQLVSWRRADSDLNYRRFFTVTTLAGIRVEEREVFEASHAEVRRWFDEGLVDGLRIDHPDGLRDPLGYLTELAELTGGAYTVVEKILEPDERLLASWPVAGTTGYAALALVDRVLTDPDGEAPLDGLEARLRGGAVDWAALVHDSKRAVADGPLAAEVARIVRELSLAGDDPAPYADAVAELLACFPVYRSYLPEGAEHLELALAEARVERPDLGEVLDRLAPVLADPGAEAALRFQQTSGMVMAKGVEDSAFYRYSRLTSLNEVGGDPSVFSMTVRDFHVAMARRQASWPAAMSALTTHDTKRSEDVRARITVLAELPHVWSDHLDVLLELAPLPDPGFGSLLWQAALGAWPISRDRLHAYAEKAMREAGDHTTWTEPDAAYESAVHGAVDAAFDDPAVHAVVASLLDHLVEPGYVNALAVKLVTLTMPGVPDVYQGSEGWELSLVDPDNRRPVDFDHLAAVLAGTEDDPAATKLQVVRTALTLRRDQPDLFTTYAPVLASGAAAGHVLAFDRGGAVTVATRLPVGLAAGGGWGDTRLDLPDRDWVDLLTDRPATGRLADLLDRHPVALLAPR